MTIERSEKIRRAYNFLSLLLGKSFQPAVQVEGTALKPGGVSVLRCVDEGTECLDLQDRVTGRREMHREVTPDIGRRSLEYSVE